MHATHADPRRFLVAALAALAAALAAVLISAADDLSLGGDSGGRAAITAEPSTPPGPPVWFTNPLAPPLQQLRATE
jgi:hypothetical protein